MKSVMDTMNDPLPDKPCACSTMVREHSFKNELPDCPHCGASAKLGYIIKRGLSSNQAQRYMCKSCKKRFVATTGTVFEKTRKSSDLWEKFIQLTINGKSIKACAEECDITVQTAFTWRHKILNAFRVHQESAMLSGQIEMDEMLIPISYKGNHIKGSFDSARKCGQGIDNNLPRKSFQRGSDNRSMSSKDKACVFCMIKNGNEGFYATVPGIGFMQPQMLDTTVAKHVDKEHAHLLADNYRTTANYLKDNGYSYETLLSNITGNERDHKPEVRDGKHLQHVNAFHHHLRQFLRPYCGVSTKYLENYVSLYIWLKNIAANKQKKQTKKISVSRASTSDCYITRKALEMRPAVPCCA
ncbi:MAG: IS1595 family transposase [Clostridia bacterium]|nr:IS1595 family transposase [Clostridia bacterium]